jgi:hypothetical protein
METCQTLSTRHTLQWRRRHPVQSHVNHSIYCAVSGWISRTAFQSSSAGSSGSRLYGSTRDTGGNETVRLSGPVAGHVQPTTCTHQSSVCSYVATHADRQNRGTKRQVVFTGQRLKEMPAVRGAVTGFLGKHTPNVKLQHGCNPKTRAQRLPSAHGTGSLPKH